MTLFGNKPLEFTRLACDERVPEIPLDDEQIQEMRGLEQKFFSLAADGKLLHLHLYKRYVGLVYRYNRHNLDGDKS